MVSRENPWNTVFSNKQWSAIVTSDLSGFDIALIGFSLIFPPNNRSIQAEESYARISPETLAKVSPEADCSGAVSSYSDPRKT